MQPRTCALCGATFTGTRRTQKYCSRECCLRHDARAGRAARHAIKASDVARVRAPVDSPPPAPPGPPSGRPCPDFIGDTNACTQSDPYTSTPPSTTTGQPRLDEAFDAARSLFRSFDNCESVTVHRNGTLSMLRAGPANEAVEDVLRDLGRAAGVTRRQEPARPARSLDLGGHA
jgi:hypothetical protein